jgi:hypothetical protein
MSVTGETNRHRRSEWILGGLTVAAILSTVLGHRFLMLVLENVGFVVLLVLAVLFVVMAWWRFVRTRNSDKVRWRVWVSLAGCVSLSLAFAIPLILFLFSFVLPWGFGPQWDFKMLMLAFGVASFLVGTLAARLVRFPLVVGGFVMAIVALILPVGV